MKACLLLHLLITLFFTSNGEGRFPRSSTSNAANQPTTAKVRIYANLAEFIEPLGKLPLQFTADEWSYIRADTVTLIGTNVTVRRQTITEDDNPTNNQHVYVRAPSSSEQIPRFVKATIVDQDSNLVKLTDNSISPDPIFVYVPSDQILYIRKPSTSTYYVDFTYYSAGAAYVSYLRSNLYWQARYELYLYDEPTPPVLIAFADIQNDGQSKVNIEQAELLAGDINLQTSTPTSNPGGDFALANSGASADSGGSVPSVGQGTELVGVYVFAIDQPFSIDGQTTYRLPMIRPQVTVVRLDSIDITYFAGDGGPVTGKATRTYRLTSDRFLPSGNCLIRENDYLVGETYLPDLAAGYQYEFSIGEDPDVVYNLTISSVPSENQGETTTESPGGSAQQTQSTYHVELDIENFKTDRAVTVVYTQTIYAQSVTLLTSNGGCTLDGSTVNCETTLAPGEEKVLSYDVVIVN